MTLYLDSLRPLLPDDIRSQLDRALLPEVKTIVDAILRLAVGADAPANNLLPSWKVLQSRALVIVDDLKCGEHTRSGQKRSREDDSLAASKRPKVVEPEEDDPRAFSLQSISVTSPIRKKVNIDVHRSSIRLTNPSSQNAEYPPIPFSSLQRVFLLPTRGKSKPHWTVALLSSDVPAAPSKGPAAAAAAKDSPSLPQLVFGIDATLTAALTTSAPDSDTTHAKGQPSLPALRTFFAHLPIRALEPSTALFRSAAGSQEGGGVPGVEAYRGAKEGTLWFLDGGVLWDGKPCEFFALEHLAPAAKGDKQPVDGVRTLSATGRTCSVILRRIGGGLPGRQGADGKGKGGKRANAGADAGEEGEGASDDEGVDIDFGMVDGREQEPIGRWIKARRHLFGRASSPPSTSATAHAENDTAPPADAKGKGKAKAREEDARNEDTEDEDDEDFAVDSDDDEESSGSDGSDSDSDASGGDGSDGEGDTSADSTGDETDGAEDEELNPKHHPLLRPGAMPRMSRAAVDAVVGIVQQDMMGGGSHALDSDDDEEDELEE